MPFAPFAALCPEVAVAETRTIIVLAGTNPHLPADAYTLEESYCDEAGCDCRRVMFCVVSGQRQRLEAVVAYGWEDLAFYRRWLRHGNPAAAADLQGPVLNLGSPQSELAPDVLDLVGGLLRADPKFVARVKRHYRLFRDMVDSDAGTTPERRLEFDGGQVAGRKPTASANGGLAAWGFKLGDSVRAKAGVVDPDSDLPISGWQGRLDEVYGDGLAVVVWDSQTVRGIDFEQLVQLEIEDLDWREAFLAPADLEKAEARDTRADVAAAVAARDRELQVDPRVQAAYEDVDQDNDPDGDGDFGDELDAVRTPAEPPHLARYDRYREAHREVSIKILDALVPEATMSEVARLLGLAGPLAALAPDAAHMLEEFVIYEWALDGRATVQRYLDEHGSDDATEREVLAGMAAAMKMVGAGRGPPRSVPGRGRAAGRGWR